VDEGVVERGKDAGNAKDELALCYRQCALRGGGCGPLTSRTWGPSWMFSCAPRSTFFLGGMLAVNWCLTGECVVVTVELLAGGGISSSLVPGATLCRCRCLASPPKLFSFSCGQHKPHLTPPPPLNMG
jgi:hypothetical protein